MGVVVQRLVNAEISGVMFTVNPVSGRDDETVIEACEGLGEALVSGHITPQRFLVNAHEDRVLEVHSDMPLLNDAQLLELANLGAAVQAYYGCPQDIEWVWADNAFQLVQSRPITAIHANGISGQWTTADFKDGGVSAAVCTPFMWSLYNYIWQDALPTYFERIKLRRKDAKPADWG